MEELLSTRSGCRGAGASMPSLGTPPSQHPRVFRSSKDLRAFCGGSVTWHRWLNQGPLLIASLGLQVGVGCKLQRSNPALVFLSTSPHPKGVWGPGLSLTSMN